MKITLRDYQKRVQVGSGVAFRENMNSQVWVMPARSGKTFTAGDTIKKVVDRGGRVAFCCHKDDLIKQSYNSFKQLGLDCGIISSKYKKEFDVSKPVQIISIATWNSRRDKLPPLDFTYAFFDEAHHLGSDTWCRMYDFFKDMNCKIIGLTATPCRLDGKSLGNYFEKMILGAKPKELIADGSLSGYDYYIPSILNMGGAKKTGGDYNKKDVKERFKKSKIMGDIPKHWYKLARDKKTIGFAPNIEQGKAIMEECELAGIRCGFLDGTDNFERREEVIGQFADGKIDILWNVNLFSEGFDLSAQVGRDVPIEAALLCRPTASLSLCVQQSTRALTKKPNKAIILDFVGNAIKHGLPDDDHEWTLDGKVKNKRASELEEKGISIAHCENCFRAFEGRLDTCPYCQTVREKTVREYEIEKQHELKKIKEIEKDSKKTRMVEMRTRLVKCKDIDEGIDVYIELFKNNENSYRNRSAGRMFLTARFGAILRNILIIR